ncbi:hypothetical protein EMCG_00695 [[Emmonsia] crescens]|uniref:Uncharacterized protein n=1 Tax=[Emmonsia] crescens TaxID=73230 RepID=A0A0G2IYA6_9EURO|nr:hypothetical protein EMCG_00695 [Emmonsia crescens UAMH 3008]
MVEAGGQGSKRHKMAKREPKESSRREGKNTSPKAARNSTQVSTERPNSEHKRLDLSLTLRRNQILGKPGRYLGF